MAKRNRVAKVKKREQAREHLQEAQVRAARAEQQQALAEEQAARARREQAEAQERHARPGQDAPRNHARAEEDRSTADRLRAKAEKLAPGLASEHARARADGGPGTAGPGDTTAGDTTAGNHTSGNYAAEQTRSADAAGGPRPPAAAGASGGLPSARPSGSGAPRR